MENLIITDAEYYFWLISGGIALVFILWGFIVYLKENKD